MSFILEDKQLADLLAYYGLSKKAQQYAGVSPQDFATVRGLIANLEKQLASPTSTITGSSIATQSEQPVSLNSTNLENLGTLIEFLARNQITIDGQRVAYVSTDKVEDPAYQLYKLQGAAGLLELANRNETVTYGYYVNKDLLIKYLDSLRGQLVKNPNPIMNTQVEGLIHQVNDQLDANMGKVYQQPAKTLPTNQLLDKLPQNIDTHNPNVEGNIVLTYGDLVSDTAFNAWIQQNNIAVDGRAYKHPQYNKCGLLKVLFTRAKFYVGNATSTQQKEIDEMYVEQAQKLATTIRCDLGSSTAPETTNQSGQTGAGHGATQQTVSLQQLAEILPLHMDQLDFGRVRDFINHYRNIVSSSNDSNRVAQADTAMQQVEQYMQAATQNTVGGNLTNFHMDGLTANDLVSWAIPPSTGQVTRAKGSARALADYLEYVVRNVYTILKDLYNSHYQQLTTIPELRSVRNLIEQQVGGTSIPYGSSIANSNIEDIRAARARLPQVGM